MEERQIMEVDVLFVGGGIACLSGALHLATLIKKHNEKVKQEGKGDPLDEIIITVLEKGAYLGSHAISGAVMDPVAFKELLPDFCHPSKKGYEVWAEGIEPVVEKYLGKRE